MKKKLKKKELSKIVMRGGDNFNFVRWGELTELKLWVKRDSSGQ